MAVKFSNILLQLSVLTCFKGKETKKSKNLNEKLVFRDSRSLVQCVAWFSTYVPLKF